MNDHARRAAFAAIARGEARLAHARRGSGPYGELLVALAWLAADYAEAALRHERGTGERAALDRAAATLYTRLARAAAPNLQDVINTAHQQRRAARRARTLAPARGGP